MVSGFSIQVSDSQGTAVGKQLAEMQLLHAAKNCHLTPKLRRFNLETMILIYRMCASGVQDIFKRLFILNRAQHR
jgi:hypothetical protein